MPKIVFLFIPKPGPCYELNTTCQWVAKDPGPKPGNCFELNADCKWIPKDKPPKPDGCFEFDEATCEWVEKEPPLNPNPSYPCWEYDEATCNWIEKDPGPNPGPCYAINGDCKWVEMPKNCWEIIVVKPAFTKDGSCTLGVCSPKAISPDIHGAVPACSGVAGYKKGHTVGWLILTYPVPNIDAYAEAIPELIACVENEPLKYAVELLPLISRLKTAIKLGRLALILRALDGAELASLFSAICECISCDPCDYIKCVEGPAGHKIVQWIQEDKPKGEACP